MRARIQLWLPLVPSVVALVSLLLATMAAGGPCPSASGGGC